jgi:formylglycine-generating enzyme required for sulfatase activity
MEETSKEYCAANLSKPVHGVSWQQARTYCTTNGGDLCTEAQWERAARASISAGVYQAPATHPWGEAAPTCSTPALCHFASGGNGCNTSSTALVDSYPDGDSFFGVVNLAGNISEWVRDDYKANYYTTGPEVDPINTDAASGKKVYRGGDWKRLAGDQKSFVRFGELDGTVGNDRIGVRCCYAAP